MVLYTYGRSFLTEDKGKERWFCTLIVGRYDLRHGKTDGSVHLWFVVPY